jgi:hypothetical protein
MGFNPTWITSKGASQQHAFLEEKHHTFGLRFNTDRSSLFQARTRVAHASKMPFQLLSLPLYLVGQAARLCEAVFKTQPTQR